MATKPSELFSATATAFWLFIGAEYVIPVSKSVKNAKRNVPLGMIIGLVLICGVQSIMVFGFHNYTPWQELMDSPAPHLLYGENLLGSVGKIWMTLVAALAVVYAEFYGEWAGEYLPGYGEDEYDAEDFCEDE